MGSLIYILSKIVDLCFGVHNLVKFSSNPGKVQFKGLVHVLRYVLDNKNLGLKYFARIYDAHLSDLFIQYIIKTEKQLMVLYDSIWQYFPDTGRSTGEYILSYQGGTIDHCTHVPGPVDQSSI